MSGRRQNLYALGVIIFSTSMHSVALRAQTIALRIGLVSTGNSAAASSIDRGVRLGALEAKQTANLFGDNVVLFEERSGGSSEAAAEKLLSRSQVEILIGSSPRDADALSRFAESHQVIFFNVASRSPTLRANCRRYTFHVEASDSMYAIAAARAAAPAPTNSVLWSATLERYGASQINNRYRGKYQAPMDGGAWAGWVAVKIASEAALRARSANAKAMLSLLESLSTSFDGHKGWPLTFRSADHQLRQPLYVVSGAPSAAGAVFRDVPQLSTISGGSSGEINADQALDALMPKSAPRCKWTAK